jgi:N-acetylneuraminate synthase
MGANVVERHFTLDKAAEGPDHSISATPDEMKFIVESIRAIEIMKGHEVKMPRGPEAINRQNNRKSLHAAQNIKMGETLTGQNIRICRPGTGIEPKYLELVIGKRATKDIEIDSLLCWGDIQ